MNAMCDVAMILHPQSPYTVHVTEKFTLYGRATLTSTDRSTVVCTGVADIAYGLCTGHCTGYKMVKPRA